MTTRTSGIGIAIIAGKVTSGIYHRHLDPMSIYLESQSAFQCIFLDPVFDQDIIVDFVKCVAWRGQ